MEGVFGGNKFVDIPNIFRDFDADPYDPASYDFTFTDALIKALFDAGVEPYYRLGVTIENQAEIKSYRINPPKDFHKWAVVCEHIIAHYLDGWADGFHYNITYWEIWNEPDDGLRVSQMWNGTKEEYYRLYEVTSKHLKGVFGDRIKVGGYSSTGFMGVYKPEILETEPRNQYFIDFFHGFMQYVKESASPIDFFSWHSYYNTEATLFMAKWVRKEVDQYGFQDIEIHLNEWDTFASERGTAHHSAEVAAMMLGMQNAPMDIMNIYDARFGGGIHSAFFDPYTYKPFHAYYAFAAFNHLYKLKNQVELVCDTDGLYAVCASDGRNNALMISNISGETLDLDIEGVDLRDARYHVIDQPRLLSWSDKVSKIENNQVVLIEF